MNWRIGQQGVSLLEALAGTAALGILAFAGASLFNQQLSNSNYIEFKVSVPFFMNQDVRDFLNSPLDCMANFGGLNPNVLTSKSSLKNSGGTNVYEKGKNYYGNIIKISGDFTMGRIPTATDPAVGNSATGTTDLKLKISPALKASGISEHQRSLKVNISTDASGKISACSTGTPNSIFDISNLNFALSGSRTLGPNAIGLINVTNDPTVKGAVMGIMYGGTGIDVCLGVMSIDHSRELYRIGGRVINGNLTDSGGIIIAPVDATGNVHVKNTDSGMCNPNGLNYTFNWTLIGFIR
jgi:hypothetical protein